jgi:hypothetical protein
MLDAQGLWAGRDLYRTTPAVTQGLGFSGLIRRTVPISHLLRHTRGCRGSILTRILTGSKSRPHCNDAQLLSIGLNLQPFTSNTNAPKRRKDFQRVEKKIHPSAHPSRSELEIVLSTPYACQVLGMKLQNQTCRSRCGTISIPPCSSVISLDFAAPHRQYWHQKVLLRDII